MEVQKTLTLLVVVRFYQPVPRQFQKPFRETLLDKTRRWRSLRLLPPNRIYGSVSGIGNAAGCKPVAFEHCWFKSNLAHQVLSYRLKINEYPR